MGLEWGLEKGFTSDDLPLHMYIKRAVYDECKAYCKIINKVLHTKSKLQQEDGEVWRCLLHIRSTGEKTIYHHTKSGWYCRQQQRSVLHHRIDEQYFCVAFYLTFVLTSCSYCWYYRWLMLLLVLLQWKKSRFSV